MNTKILLHKWFLLLFASVIILLPACQNDDSVNPTQLTLVKNQDPSVAIDWMELFLEIDRYAQGYRPGPCPRALAYINLAAYESVMKGMPDFKSVKSLYPGLTMPDAHSGEEYHWPTVVNAVYGSLMKRFFPGSVIIPDQQTSLQFKILSLEQTYNDEYAAKVPGKIFSRSKEHGEAVANAIWEWSKTDPAGHEAYLNPLPADYNPPVGPGLWQPTPPQYLQAMFPYWGKVRTFAIKEEDKLARPPLTFSENPNSPLYAQAVEVKNIVDNLDFTNQWIAEFWSDDFVGQMFSPPSRFISITLQVLEKENANLEMVVYTLAKVSLALNDASVACWRSKYFYNVERPVTYINRVIDPNWQPHWNSTPNFPAYPSGHATFGAAASEVLSHIFGYNYAMADRSHESRTDFYGMPRSFATFYEMAEENAYSRIPLGVHFRMDAEEGVRLGYLVGRRINDMPFKK
jgi:hypothetical protein